MMKMLLLMLTSSVLITASYAVPEKQQLENVTVLAGYAAKFTANVSADSDKVQWKMGDESLQSSTKYAIQNATGTTSLTIFNCTLADTGQYSMWDGRDNRYSKSKGQLTVYEAASITVVDEELKSPRTLKPGDKIEIAAIIGGFPLPVTSWSHGGKPLRPDSDAVSIVVTHKSSTLTIDNAKTEHTGTYVLMATNAGGFKTAEFHITVTETSSAVSVVSTLNAVIVSPVVVISVSVLLTR